MKSLKFVIPLALFLLLAVLLAMGLGRDPKEVPSPLIGKPAPAFSNPKLEDANGTIKRDDMLGQVWMLNVWASWCVACREEHPLLVQFSKRKVLPVVGLNYKDDRNAGLQWLARFGNPYDTSVYDLEGKVGIDYGVYGVPETFIIDKQGIIRFKHIGPLTPEVIRDKVEPLVRKLNA